VRRSITAIANVDSCILWRWGRWSVVTMWRVSKKSLLHHVSKKEHGRREAHNELIPCHVSTRSTRSSYHRPQSLSATPRAAVLPTPRAWSWAPHRVWPPTLRVACLPDAVLHAVRATCTYGRVAVAANQSDRMLRSERRNRGGRN
jgi:hypothetical protein